MNREILKNRIAIITCALTLGILLLASLVDVSLAHASGKKEASTPTATQSYNADAMRMQGEQRFRANCGRCHAAPQKFSPRVMATVVRHMRVRATITDEDMRLVLFYMSQ
jgi:cytochrome c5